MPLHRRRPIILAVALLRGMWQAGWMGHRPRAGSVDGCGQAKGVDQQALKRQHLHQLLQRRRQQQHQQPHQHPQQHGGGQEGGLRAGTVPVPLIVGLQSALDLALADREARAERLKALRERLWEALEGLGGITLNGHPDARLAHNLNVSVGGVDGSRLHQLLRRSIAVSSGSACSQGSPSHVLAALGRSRQEAAASIRFGLGRATQPAEITAAITAVTGAVAELRLPPLALNAKAFRSWPPAAEASAGPP